MLDSFNLTSLTSRLVASDWLEELGRFGEAELLRSNAPIRVEDGVARPDWSKEEILPMLESNNKAVYRALEVLLERQTADERQSENTVHSNGRGFNARDAKFGTDLANRVIHWRSGKSTYLYPLTAYQLAAARRMLRKYAGQLARVANGEEREVAV